MMIIPAIWITELALIVSSSQLPSISQAVLKSYSSALFSARGIMTFYYCMILREVGNWKVGSGNCLWPSLDLNVPHPRFYPGSTYSPWFKTSELLLLCVQRQDNCSAPARWTEWVWGQTVLGGVREVSLQPSIVVSSWFCGVTALLRIPSRAGFPELSS